MNNDLISRSALLDRLTTERFAHYHTVHTDTASLVQHDQEFNVCMGIVFDFPAVDAEVVRHGRWIMRGGYIRCSECDAKTLWKDTGGTGGFSHEYEQVRSVHCHNCGAKMDAEVQDGTKQY